MKAPLRELREVFAYDPETGLITRLKDRGTNAPAGRVAGCINSNGYVQIQFKGVLYLAHRLGWALHHRAWPELQVDHINRNRADNRILNLRQATRPQQAANSAVPSTNKSGFKGVFWFRRRWRVEVGNRHVGCFSTIEEARAAYMREARRRYGEFASDGHGVPA